MPLFSLRSLALLVGLVALTPASFAQDGPLAPVPSRTPATISGARGADGFAVQERWPYGYTRAVAMTPEGVGVTMQGSVFQTLDLSNPAAISVLGELVMPGVASDMASEGSLVALVTTHFRAENTGLFLIDVSDPLAPTLRGSLTGIGATSVAIKDGVVYIGTYEASDGGPEISLRIVSVTDPDAPVEVGSLLTPSFPDDIAILGDQVYLALNVAGVQIVDTSTPASPVINTTSITSYTGAVAVGEVGGVPRLATAERNASGVGMLRIYSLADPAVPALQGEDAFRSAVTFGAIPFDLVWTGDRIIAGTGSGGLQFADVDDPTAPNVRIRRETRTAFVTNAASRVATNGTKALVADFFSGVHQAELVQRRITGHMPSTGGVALGAVVDGASGRIFVANGPKGVAVLASSGGSLSQVTSRHGSLWNYTSDIAQSATHVYAADGFGGIQTISKSGLTSTSNVLRDSTIREVEVSDDGSLLYAIDDEKRLYILSLATPGAPVRRSTVQLADGASGVAGTGSVMWVGEDDGNKLRVYDTTNPAAPTEVGQVTLTGSGFRLSREGDRLYALGNGLVANILDVSSPLAPTLLGNAQSVLPKEALDTQNGILVMGGIGITAHDVSAPSASTQIGFTDDIGDVASGVAFTATPNLSVVTANHAGVYLLATPAPTACDCLPPTVGLRLTPGPNPSRGDIAVEVQSGSPEAITLRAYDALGRLVRILASGVRVDERTVIVWDGRSDSGAMLPSGVYLLRAQSASGAVTTEQVTLVR